MKANKKLERVARRLFRLCRVDGRLEAARVRIVVRRLAGSGRRGTTAILGELVRLWRLDRDARRAVVESATALPDDLRIEVESGLARVYGQGLDTSFEINP